MFPYWLLFVLVAGGTIMTPISREREQQILLAFVCLLIAIMIGFRFEVGADWRAYQHYFDYAAYASLGNTLKLGEPGYHSIEWIIQQVGGPLWWLNLFCGCVFAWGLFRFAKVQPDPWLTVMVAVPYLVVVVAMGYSRQSVAIGILMSGMADFKRRGTVLRFVVYVALAATFHRSAVAAFPLVAHAAPRNRFANLLLGVAASYLLYSFFLADTLDRYVNAYIKTGYASQGAAIRVVMDVFAAVLFLIFGRSMGFDEIERRIWRNFSFCAICLLAWLWIAASSTSVDRIALYVIPLQLAVIPRVAWLFKNPKNGRLLIIAYCFIILFAWLNFAVHARYWVPYKVIGTSAGPESSFR